MLQTRAAPFETVETGALPPGPEVTPLFQVLRWLREPLAFLDECAARYGDAFTIRLAGGPPLVVFSHPRDVREILAHDPDRLRAGAANAALGPVLGARSLLVLDGSHHRELRKLMLPPFHGDRLAAYGAAMREVVDRHVDAWPLDRPFALHAAMQHVALDVILRTVFGDDATGVASLRAAVLDLLALTAQPFVRLPWPSTRPREARRWQRLVAARARLDEALRGVLERLHDASDGTVLGLLREARDGAGQPLSEAELLDELVTVLVAGHETTATALAWAFHHLLRTPAVTARLAAGVDERYLDAVIDETLRLQPVFAVVGRQLAGPTTIGGFDLPAGCIAAPCIYLVHRRLEVWQAPEAFDPDRFLRRTPTPYEFLPFGGGSRRCLGMAFARFEMRIVLARVLARTRLRAAPGAPARSVRRSITFAPAGGVPTILEARLD